MAYASKQAECGGPAERLAAVQKGVQAVHGSLTKQLAKMHTSEILRGVKDGFVVLKWSRTVPRIVCHDCRQWRNDDGTRCPNCDTYDRPVLREQFDYYLSDPIGARIKIAHYARHERGLIAKAEEVMPIDQEDRVDPCSHNEDAGQQIVSGSGCPASKEERKVRTKKVTCCLPWESEA